MMKFASAVALCLTAAQAFEPNTQLEEGSIRMRAEPVRSTHGGLAGVLRDTKFTIKDQVSNESYLFMDTSVYFEETNYEKLQLKNRVDQFHKNQLMKQQAEARSKFGGQNHRLGLNNKIDTVMSVDQLYSLSIFVGESDQEIKVLFDTGSDWLLIEGRDCKTCLNSKYDPNTSSYFQKSDLVLRAIEYGTFFHIKGKKVKDQVCLSSFSLCVDPYEFILIEEQFGIDKELDGILGMCQGYAPRGFNVPKNFDVGPLYLDYLRLAEHITEKAFSTRFTGRFGDNFVDFGPAREAEMSSIEDYVEIPVNKGYFYSAIPQGVRFGGETSDKAYKLNEVEAIFTTGISISMVPSSISKDFFTRLLENVEAVEKNGVFHVNCGDKIDDLWFMFEEHWIEIKGEHLLMDISEEQDNTMCILNFLPSVDDFWVLGNTILRDYYVYHNPEKGVTGWAPTKKEVKTTLKLDKVPTVDIQFKYNWTMVWIKLGTTVGMWILTWAIAQYLFTTTTKGISFLNKASYKPTGRNQKKNADIHEQIEDLSADKIQALLTAIQLKRAKAVATNSLN